MRARCILIVLLALLPVLSASAHFMVTDEPVPVPRLLENIQRHIQQHPDRAHGYYVLGRVHALAYARDDGQVMVQPRGDQEHPALPGFAPYSSVQVHRQNEAALSDNARDHMRRSIENYREAVKRDSGKPLYWLGLGWMLEQAARHQAIAATQPTTVPSTQPSADQLTQEALAAYDRAFDLALRTDLKAEDHLLAGDSIVSMEAAQNAIRLLKGHERNDADWQKVAKYERGLAKINEKGFAITPILFPLDRPRPLSELIDTDARVGFDLASTGRGERWPWITPQAGLLVWDPQHTGKITSGRQLFGSVTWWMLFENGYHALAALDDNADGWLAAREMDGIAVWCDRNSNGVSEPGEVVPAQSMGIAGIAVRGTTRDGTLQHAGGILFSDGKSVPSYDWTPTASIPGASR